MAYEPETRVETLVMLRTDGRFKGQVPRYRQARYSLVSYDGSPEQLIEPRSACVLFDPTEQTIPTASATNNYRNLVTRIEYYENNPFSELHDFSPTGL